MVYIHLTGTFASMWKLVIKAGLHIVSSRLSDIVAWLVPLSLKNSIESIVSGLVFAAASYYIWQELNNRLFSNDPRQEEHVFDAIMETLDLVLLMNFKEIMLNHLGKFDGKADEGFFVGYSLNSKAFRVFSSRTRIVKENLHIRFSESTPNAVGTQSNGFAGTKASDNADPKSSHDDGSKPSSDDGKKVDEDPRKESKCNDQEKEDNVNITNNVNVVGTNEVNVVGGKTSIELLFDLNMPALEDYNIFDFSKDDEDDGVLADMNNLDTTI
ncbi:ribonuclease H-like domain-containing protein [Tanacetum coccineum]